MKRNTQKMEYLDEEQDAVVLVRSNGLVTINQKNFLGKGFEGVTLDSKQITKLLEVLKSE